MYKLPVHPSLGWDKQLMVSRCLAGVSRSVGLSIHAQLKAMTYTALADLQDRAGGMAEHGSPLGHCQSLARDWGGQVEQ